MKKIICCVLFGLLSSVYAADTTRLALSQQKTLSAPGGRFVLGQISDMRMDQYMLDTQTGRLWHVVTYTPRNQDGSVGDERNLLLPVQYVTDSGKFSPTP